MIVVFTITSVRIDVDKWLAEAREDAEKIRADPVYAEQRKQERELAVIIPQHEAKRRRIMGPDYVERKHRPVPQPRMQPKPTNARPAKTFKDENEKPQTQAQVPPQTQSKPPATQGPSYAQIQAQIQANANKSNVQGLSHLTKPVPVSLDLKPVNSRPQAVKPVATSSTYPCALCPEHSTEGLVRIANPGAKHKNKTLFAHKICVTFTPTTWVASDPQTGEELVYGFELIEKERWNLKCGLCSDRHGTKVGERQKLYHFSESKAELSCYMCFADPMYKDSEMRTSFPHNVCHKRGFRSHSRCTSWRAQRTGSNTRSASAANPGQ